jgi:hypothetical protein
MAAIVSSALYAQPEGQERGYWVNDKGGRFNWGNSTNDEVAEYGDFGGLFGEAIPMMLGYHRAFESTNQPNAQNQQMKQVRPTYESNSLADLYNKPDYTQQAWNPYGYDYAPPSYNPNDMYGFGQTDAGQDTYGM